MSEAALNLLVPVDFSECSRRALAWAFDYAQRAPCDVHLVHVVERHLTLKDLVEVSADSLREELGEIAEVARRELAAMAPTAEARAAVGAVHHHIAVGKPATEILRVADDVGADLIVMGTHGLTGAVERLFVGSVAQRVVRAAPCTVVCVKPTQSRNAD